MHKTLIASALLAALTGLGASGTVHAEEHAGDYIPAPQARDYPGTIDIHVDATDVQHRIFSVHETVPVKSGHTVYLQYPEWIPGHHRPSGPIDQMAGLVIHDADGNRIAWKRDPYNVYAFRVEVPDDVSELDVAFKFLAAQDRSEGPIRMTPEMVNLSWEKVSLYPAGYNADQIETHPSVTLPQGWQLGTALETASTDGNTTTFKNIDYLNLIDSPIFAGEHFKRLDLTSENSPPVHMDIVADSADDLDIGDDARQALDNIVKQMHALYGAFHFDHYDYLLAVSDKMSGKGLEHSRSSENIVGADWFTDWSDNQRHDLLTHEFNHSWDGKYRRDKLHATPNFNVTMNDRLMWVFEGQTQFYGNVLAVRSGLENKDTGMAKLANVAATYDKNRPAFTTWRNIQDTTNDPTIAHRAPLPYRNYQGSEDYYSGGQLIWLAVDGKLRQLSDNKHSLDDFAKAFYGMNAGDWDINTFQPQDVYDTLSEIEPYDWKSFLRKRLDGHTPVTDGLASEGWKLVYTSEPDAAHKAMKHGDRARFAWSIGFSANDDGDLYDVRWHGPAFEAGLAPGMKIVAVNGTEYSRDAMEHAIKQARDGDDPIELQVKNFDQYKTLDVDYHDGMKYPSLKRIKGKPDHLSELYEAK